MKMKLTVLSLLGLGAILPGVSYPAAAQTTQKLAVINIQQAIVETKDGQKARNDLQAKFGPTQKELQDKQAKLAALHQSRHLVPYLVDLRARDAHEHPLPAATRVRY